MTVSRIDRSKMPGPCRRRASSAAILLLSVLLAAARPSSAEGVPVAGTVLDTEGRALEGAEVTLHAVLTPAERGALLARGRDQPEPAARARSDHEGHFRLEAPEVGFWTVVVRSQGRVPVEHPVWPLLRPEELEPVALLPDAGLAVQVVDEAGRPIPAAVVQADVSGTPSGPLLGWRGGWQPLSRRVAASSDEGRLRLPRLEGETMTLWAVAPGRSARTAAGARPAGGPGRPVRLVLPAGPIRRLQVLAPDGRPAPGSVVWLSGPLPAGVTGDDGRLDVPLAPAGSSEAVAIQVDSPDGLVAETEVGGPGDGEEQETPVQVRLGPPSVAAGRVLEAGSTDGLAGALVWLGADPSAAVRTGAGGAFRVAVRRPRLRGAVHAAAPGFLQAAAGLPETGHGSDGGVSLVLEPAAVLEGSVVDAEGSAVPGAVVRAAGLAIPGFALSRSRGFARTGSDGRFRVEDLDPREQHLVHVGLRGYGPAIERVPPAVEEPGALRPGRFRELQVVLHRSRAIRGRVVDPGGEPVAGARVMAAPEERDRFWLALASGTSAPDGSFELDQVLPGPCVVAVFASGYASVETTGIELPADGGATDLGDLVLQPESFIPGRVVDPEGAPIAGASVHFWVNTRGRRPPLLTGLVSPPPVVTGEDGVFRLSGLPAGEEVRLQVVKEGHVGEPMGGIWTPAEEPVTVVLRPTPAPAGVAGVVLSERGGPVPGAVVRTPSLARMVERDALARADDRGAFEVTGLPAGELALMAEAPRHQASPEVRLDLAPGERREGVELVLAEGVVVTGRVQEPGALPAGGASVTARGGDESGASWFLFVETDADGRFTFDTLAPGAIVLAAAKDGFVTVREEIELGPDGASVDLHLASGAEVSGRVFEPDGSPAWGRELELFGGPTVFERRSYSARSVADGSFVFRGVPEGEYRLTVKDGGAPVWVHPDVLSIEGNLPVTGLEVRQQPTVTLVGRFLGLEPGELQGAAVMATVSTPGLYGSQGGEVLDDGNYRISGLAPGTWEVTAEVARTGRQALGSVEIEAGQRQAALDLEFEPGYSVSGAVIAAGEPVPEAAVRLTGLTVSGSLLVATDHWGRFRLAGVPAGRHTLTVGKPGYIDHESEVEVAGGDIELAPVLLEPAGRR